MAAAQHIQSVLSPAQWRAFYRLFVRQGSRVFARQSIPKIPVDPKWITDPASFSEPPSPHLQALSEKDTMLGSNSNYRLYIKALKSRFADPKRLDAQILDILSDQPSPKNVPQRPTIVSQHWQDTQDTQDHQRPAAHDGARPANIAIDYQDATVRQKVLQKLNRTAQLVCNAAHTRGLYEQSQTNRYNKHMYPNEYILLSNLLQSSRKNKSSLIRQVARGKSSLKSKKKVFVDPSMQLFQQVIEKMNNSLGIWI